MGRTMHYCNHCDYKSNRGWGVNRHKDLKQIKIFNIGEGVASALANLILPILPLFRTNSSINKYMK